MSMYGNYNLAQAGKSQFLNVNGTSDTLTMSSNIQGLWFYSTQDCWINIGTGTVVAAKPAAEMLAVDSFFLPANTIKEVAVPASTDEKPCVVAATQDSAAGTLHVQEWKLS